MARESLDRPEIIGDPVGQFYTWWRGDPLPRIAAPRHLTVEPWSDEPGDTSFSEFDVRQRLQRLDAGHRPWVARLDGDIVAWGWVATQEAGISELGLRFSLRERERYLWDFVTLPGRRGLGVYPAMLRAILTSERDADRFWIGHDLDNDASRRGILKAGFTRVGAVYPTTGGLVYAPEGPADRARAAADLLVLPVMAPSVDGRPATTGPDMRRRR